LNDPSEHGRDNVSAGDTSSLFEDYCNCQRISEFEQWIGQSVGAAIVDEVK